MHSARRGAHTTAAGPARRGAHAAGYDDSFGKQIIDPRSKLAVPSCVATMLLTMWLYRTPPEDIALPLGKKAAKAAAADDVDIISTLASDANPNPGAAKRATKSPKRDKAALRFHE